jgi:energy-coupling factor transport system ATP-binding protein
MGRRIRLAYIEIKDLSYKYPLEDKLTLDNINLRLNKGEIMLVTGKSGSGKSTLAKAIVGTVPSFYGGSIKGYVNIEGEDINKMSHSQRAKEITMVFQHPERQLMMNKVHREIAFGLENIGVDEGVIKRRVWEAMQFADILHLANRNINTLSGGEKQKVAIASSIAYMPKCIVLDEPTSQLDPPSAESIVNLVRKINTELGMSIVLIEQRVNKWFDVADKIGYMENNKLTVFESTNEFFNKCSGNMVGFMPDYLRFFKKNNIDYFPRDFKNARDYLEDEFADNKPKSSEELLFAKDKISSKIHNSIINIKKLNTYYDSLQVLDNVNIDILNGEFVSIMGANGSGKSTLLKSIIGLKEYKGSIKINSKEVKKTNRKELSRLVGYVSQDPSEYISKDSVYEELKFTMDNFNSFDEEAINNTLKDLDIYHLKDKNPRDLSGGEKQRLAIASILVMNPKILLLDEPTRGLDLEVKSKLGNVLKNLNEQGTTILMITHDVEFSSNYCNRFILMFNREIVADGNRDEVLSDGIYYNTTLNKLFKNIDKTIFTEEEAMDFISCNYINSVV